MSRTVFAFGRITHGVPFRAERIDGAWLSSVMGEHICADPTAAEAWEALDEERSALADWFRWGAEDKARAAA